MQGLFSWVVDNLIVWVIAGYAAYEFVKAVGEQKIARAIWAAVLGGLAYYFAKNPQTVLEWVSSNIIGKLFGR